MSPQECSFVNHSGMTAFPANMQRAQQPNIAPAPQALGSAYAASPASSGNSQMPIVYYVCQPTLPSNGVWMPCPSPQPGVPLMVAGNGGVQSVSCAGICSEALTASTSFSEMSRTESSSTQRSVLPQSSAGRMPCGGFPVDEAKQYSLNGTVGESQSPCELHIEAQLSGRTSTDAEEEADGKSSRAMPSSPVASSSGSTSPSKRRRRQRARPAERQAVAEKHRLGQHLAELCLEQKDTYMARLEAGGEASAAVVAELRGAVWHLSLDTNGCEIVQLAIEKAQGASRATLCEELHGHVREAMGSPFANLVIQKIVEVMPIDTAEFVANEMSGIAVEACRHRYGSRMMCRLIEQFGASAACVAKLEKEIMVNDVASLIQHSFGRYVIQAILAHGSAMHKSMIARELAKDLHGNVTNRSGSYVMETAFTNCSEEDVAMLAVKIVFEENLVPVLVQHPFGIFVVRSLLEMPGDFSARVAYDINSAAPAVQESEHYQRLLRLLKVDEEDDVA